MAQRCLSGLLLYDLMPVVVELSNVEAQWEGS